jgi:glycosyltransferase involved in cell wall biosynthesis
MINWTIHQFKRVIHVGKVLKNIADINGGLIPGLKKLLSRLKTQGIKGTYQNLLNTFDRLHSYHKWIELNDTLTPKHKKAIENAIDNMAKQPLISVVMPTYNPNPEWLKEAIQSVQQQLYPYWELCIADDCSTDPQIKSILDSFSQQDARIKVVFRQENGHISAASNSALKLSSGEWIALLDHDDLLPEHALYHVAKTINQHPDVQMIYSDEDKLDEKEQRYTPYFKCDWNLELFHSQNMFSHLGVYHASLIKKVEGFRLGYEGSQDYDLALRCIEHVEAHQIKHIPHILYHWRMHSESTAQSGNAKPYTVIAGEKALNDHFQRQGVNAEVITLEHGYRIKYALPEPTPLVSLLIPTKNGLNLIRQCIHSILEKTTYTNFEIIIIDNGSDEPAVLTYFEQITADPRISVLRDERPFNFSQLNNSALAHAKGEFVALINNDIEVITPEWLTELVSHAARPGIGAVGAKLLYPDDTIQHAGVITGLGGVAGHAFHGLQDSANSYFWRAHLTSELSAVTAACLVIKKAIYEEVGGFNENELKVAFNDVDFCLKVKAAGYRNIYTPFATLYHHESVSRGLDDTPEKQARFNSEVDYMQKTWGHLLSEDPAYSPNLTLDQPNFSFAWPARTDIVK